MIITNRPDRYPKGWRAGGFVIPGEIRNVSPERIQRIYGGKTFWELENTCSGPCLILGMGPSRSKIAGRKVKMPVIAINRAILERPDASYWAAHDFESIGDCIDRSPAGVPLVTVGSITNKKGADEAIKKHPPIWVKLFSDPTRHKARPLYWNQTTTGWVIHFAIRCGYDPIYFLGQDLTTGGYVNPHFSERELRLQHLGVKERMVAMFSPSQKPMWYDKPVRLLDCSGGNLPVEKADVSELLA